MRTYVGKGKEPRRNLRRRPGQWHATRARATASTVVAATATWTDKVRDAGMRRNSRVDLLQPQIVSGLRAVGAAFQYAHMIGDGCRDIMAGDGGRSYRLEIKVEETAS